MDRRGAALLGHRSVENGTAEFDRGGRPPGTGQRPSPPRPVRMRALTRPGPIVRLRRLADGGPSGYRKRTRRCIHRRRDADALELLEGSGGGVDAGVRRSRGYGTCGDGRRSAFLPDPVHLGRELGGGAGHAAHAAPRNDGDYDDNDGGYDDATSPPVLPESSSPCSSRIWRNTFPENASTSGPTGMATES